MFKYCRVLICIFLFFSCSDDGPLAGCFQDEGRRIVSTINDVNGIITFKEDCGYLFDPDVQLDKNPTGVLFPCNLDMEDRIGQSRILFSGFIYESFENEDICADFFQITEIEVFSESE